jgi:glyoxylase-like metal-dependent hydrolase (beta-lactamase superfamily II)
MRHPDPSAFRIEYQGGLLQSPLRTPTLPPAAHTNAWLVDLGDATAVVDPGSPWPEEQAKLDERLATLAAEGRPAREVWVTHGHADHVGGVAALAARGLTVRAHPAIAPRLGGVPFLPLAEGDLLAGRWRVHATPGHARDHLVFVDEVSGALLAGDMVSTLSTVVIDPPEGDMAEYERQLARLAGLGVRALYPAHGPPAARGRATLLAYLAHRAEREAKVVAALDPPAPLDEVTARAYQDVPPVVWPVAARSCLATLLKLAAQGLAEESGGSWRRKK